MHWHNKLQIVLIFCIMQCIRTSGTENDSLIEDDLDYDKQLIKADLSKLLWTSIEIPMEEIKNRSEFKNITIIETLRFSLIEYYMAGLQIVFQRLLADKLKIRVTKENERYQKQLNALQMRHEIYNQNMIRWRLYMSQVYFKVIKQELDDKSAAKNSKIPTYPSSISPNYYAVMMITKSVVNVGIKPEDDTKKDADTVTDVDRRFDNSKSSTFYKRTINLVFVDETRIFHFYIREIFRLTAFLMNQTHYIM